MRQDTKIGDWIGELCGVLLAGGTSAHAIDRATRLGAERADAEAAAKQLECSPKLALARHLAVQLSCSRWLLATYATLGQLRQDPSTIDQLGSIDQSDFLVDYYSSNRALFLPGVASEWSAVKLWDKGYLKARCGAEIVEVMMGREAAPIPSQNTADCLKRSMRFGDYLDLVYSDVQSNDYYLVARNRFFASPNTAQLLDDCGLLSFVNTRSAPSDVKLWLGPLGTYTPLHYDARNNLLVQVVGTKLIRMYPPYYAEFMEQTVPWYANVDPGLAQTSARQHGGDAPVPEISVRLAPGDALFIPVGWWHAVTSESVSLSLNFHDFGVPNEYPFP